MHSHLGTALQRDRQHLLKFAQAEYLTCQYLQEGYVADIVVFDPDTISDKATFREPHQYSVGIAYLIIDGKIVIDHDEYTGVLAGKPLKSTLTPE